MAPGGSTDNVARELANALSERLKQSVIVQSVAGAGGAVAAQKVKSAPPDGSTFLFTTNSLLVNQVLRKKPEFDFRKDFVAAAAILEGPFGVFIHPSLPAKTLRELIEYAKANPGKLNYGSSGVGSSMHLAAEELNVLGGIKLFHVAYKGGNPALLDMLSNRVQVALLSTSTQHQQLAESGKLRVLAVTSKHRLPSMPNVPTTDEAGVPGYHPSFWMGLFAPTGTPPAILGKVNGDLRAILALPEIRKRYAMQNYNILSMTPDEAQRKVAEEITQLMKTVEAAGIERQ